MDASSPIRLIATPNLPGHNIIGPDNWYVRCNSASGFRRGKDGKRPMSAGPMSNLRTTVSATQLGDPFVQVDINNDSQFLIEGSQMTLEGGIGQQSTIAARARPKTSNTRSNPTTTTTTTTSAINSSSSKRHPRTFQKIADPYHQPPIEAENRYAGPISPIVSHIRRKPDSAGPMTMARDESHVHTTSPFGRDRYLTGTATATYTISKNLPVTTLDRYGYPNDTTTPKPVIEHEKRVCRYSAFFYEDRVWDKTCPIGSPSIEQIVVRHLVISYYLIDNTVSIFEKKQTNVGIDGGKFFRRAQLMKDDDALPVGLADLVPGRPLRVLGQEIMIRDADSFSRGVVEYELGLTLPPGLPKPVVAREDLGVHYALGMGKTPPPKRADNLYPPAYDFYQRKDALEKTHRFLFAERTPLCFECFEVLDNVQAGKLPPSNLSEYRLRASRQPDAPLIVPINAQRLGLYYYIADYQVEVSLCFKSGEKAEHNENKTVLKKSKLPKNWHDVSKGGAPVYFEPKDFICGQTVDLYGKIYFIVYCNPWTRGVCERMGLVQAEVPVVVEERKVVVHEIPGHGDGYLAIGLPEETLATVYGHANAAHALRKDTSNLGRQLRCKTILISDLPGHDKRLFNLFFFMEDSSIQVHEEMVRNSGFPGGMLLKRCRAINALPPDQTEPRIFKAQDIHLGNVIAFNGLEMQIIEMDGATLMFCEQHPEEFPLSDVFDIILRLLQSVVEGAVDVRSNFYQHDSNRSGMLSRGLFIEALDAMHLTESLNDQQLLTLARRFKFKDQHKKKRNIFSAKKEDDGDDNEEESGDSLIGEDKGKYLYEELCDLFSHVHCIDMGGKRKPHLGLQQVDSLQFLLTYARSCTTQWRRVLRIDPLAFGGIIKLDALAGCMLRYGVVLSMQTKREIALKFGASVVESDQYRSQLSKYASDTRMIAAKLHDTKHPNLGVDKFAGGAAATAAEIAATLGSIGQSTPMGPQPGSPNFVQTRRNMIQRPVLRSVKGLGAGASPNAATATQQIDDNQVMVSFRALCDAIYLSDWVMSRRE